MTFRKGVISDFIIFWSLWLLVATVHRSTANSGDEPEDGTSASFSDSGGVDINDRNPCSFRGSFLLHDQEKRLDPCTFCICSNGTTTCHISSCPIDSGCPPYEITIIPEECCPQCPYKMIVENVYNLYDDNFESVEGESRRIRFGIEVEVNRELSSRMVRGDDLWKVSAWLSRHEDGSGAKYSFENNVLGAKKKRADEYDRQEHRSTPWHWSKLGYTMSFTEGTVDDRRFFCVEFGQADNPSSLYDLSFTFRPVNNDRGRLVDCVELDGYNGVTAERLYWTMRTENTSYGQDTSVTLDVTVIFTRESAHMRRHGEGLWRVALFGSGTIDGSGPRFSETRQILDKEEMATSKHARNLTINDIDVDFEIGDNGCLGGAYYICVEFAQGDTPAPPFRMTTKTPTNTLVECREQECYNDVLSHTTQPTAPSSIPPTNDVHPASPHAGISVVVLVIVLLAITLVAGALLVILWRNKIRARSSPSNDPHLLDDVASKETGRSD